MKRRLAWGRVDTYCGEVGGVFVNIRLLQQRLVQLPQLHAYVFSLARGGGIQRISRLDRGSGQGSVNTRCG